MKYPKLVPPKICTVPCTVSIETEGITEDGAPEEAFTAELNCNYQDSSKKVITSDKTEVQLTGSALFDGDIAPSLAVISKGTLTIFGEERMIVQGTKARNPDGTVNYTRLDVI